MLVGRRNRLVVHAETPLGGPLAHQRLAHVLVEELVLEPCAHGRRHVGLELLLVFGLLLLPGVLQQSARHLLAVDLEPVAGRAETQVHDTVGAPQGKDQDQQSQQENCQPALALQCVTDILQHNS